MADDRPGGPTNEDINNAQRLKDIFVEMNDTLKSINVLMGRQIKEAVEGLDEDSQKIAKNLGRELAAELKKSTVQTEKLKNNSSDLSKGLKTAASIESQIASVKARQQRIDDLMVELSLAQNGLTADQQKLQSDIAVQLNKQLEILTNQLTTAQKMQSVMQGYASFLKGISNIPFLGGFLSSLINSNKILKEMEKAAMQGAGKLKTLGVGIAATFKSLGQGIIIGLLTKGFKFLIDSVIQLDQKVFNLANSLGVAVDQATELQNKFVQIANSSTNAGLAAKDLGKTYVEMSNSLGFLVSSNREFVETATLIQKRIGASAEGMAALATQAAISGQTLMQSYGTLNATRQIEGARNKLALTNKQIIEGIAKTSSVVTINLRNSVAALAEGIIRATKLGTTLDQVNKQGESLLDFESSISKEFEAQILTGRNINLTRARELALLGDTRGLMEELNRQQVTYDQFQNQNVIARRAEAEALGLSVEELSKILLQRKQAELLGAAEGQSLTDRYNQLVKAGATEAQIITMLGDKQAAIDLARASRQERFQNAIEKLRDTLGSILEGPLGGLIDKFANFVSDGRKMAALAEKLKGIFEGIGNVLGRLPGLLSGALEITKVLTSLAIARAVASAFAAAGPLGLAAGAAAGLYAYNFLSDIANLPAKGAPTIPAGNETAMTAPISPATALVQQNRAVTEEAKAKPPVFNFKVNTMVGTDNWSRQSRTSIQQDFGSTIS